MKKLFLMILGSALLILTLNTLSSAQCPEAPDDRGECDTLNVICLDCERTEGEPGPYSVRFPLLVTHDQTQASDSIAGFAIPLAYTHTNPSAYCSVSAWWNTTSMLWMYPDFNRSIYRHMFETDYVSTVDTLYPNRMAQLEGDFSYRGWDMTILDLDGTSHFWLTIVPTGAQDQRWWESDRVLLATMTMRIEDTMEVCVDTTFWPPATSVTFSRSDAVTYIPRDNMPNCFWVGPPLPPDFAIDAEPDTQEVVAGNPVDYDVILTSLQGFSSSVDLSVSGLPTDASATFDPDPVVPTDTSVMTVNTAATTPAGTFTLTITGTEVTKAPIEHSTDVVLKVLTPEAIAVTAPNGGEEWCVGSSQNITWTSSGIDTVKIEYSTNGGSAWVTETEKVPAAAGTYSWTIPDVSSANCLVRMCDAADANPCDQSDAVFTIQKTPIAPSGCIASDDLCDKVSFSWTDNSGNEAGFIIYRGGSALDTVGTNITSYDDLTASPGVSYEYCVSAYNDCGESSQCCENGTRLSPPAAPTDCVASDDLCDKVSFCWTDNSDDESGFYIYRNGTKVDSVGTDVNCYDDAAGTPGVTYNYCVKAYNDCGESSQCCDNGTRLAPPDPPSDCTASDDLCDKVSFSWTDNSDDELGFIIYRGGSALDTVEVDIASYDDPTAAPGVTYEYCVTAYNSCGESGQCCDNGVVSTEAITVTAPDGGETWSVGSSQDITWSSTCMDSVKIEYSTDGGSNWFTEVEKTPAGAGTYTWTVPDAPSEDCLVRICDAADESPCDESDATFAIVLEDFAIEVLPDTLRIMRTVPEDSFYTVELTSIGGFDSPCTLSVSGLPSGVTGVFDPPTVVPTGTAELIMSADGSVPEGYYDLTVTATELAGFKAISHNKDVVLMVVLPTWGFHLEADPDSQDVVVGNQVTYDITMFPDIGFLAPCTLYLDNGLPPDASFGFAPQVIFPHETSVLTVTTAASTPGGVYQLEIRGIANYKQQDYVDVILATLVVQDFAIAATPDTHYVTQGQSVGFDILLTTLTGFADPCSLFVSGLPDPPDSGVFDQAEILPPGSTTLNVYTTAETDTGWYTLTITARSLPTGKAEPAEHSTEAFLKVNQASDVDDWADDFSRPQSFTLFQNQPNPFNPETNISYCLPEASQVTLTVYNILGQKVKTLFQDYQDAGTHSVMWDGRSDGGTQLSSGVYFYMMQAGSFRQTKKMTLMK